MPARPAQTTASRGTGAQSTSPSKRGRSQHRGHSCRPRLAAMVGGAQRDDAKPDRENQLHPPQRQAAHQLAASLHLALHVLRGRHAQHRRHGDGGDSRQPAHHVQRPRRAGRCAAWTATSRRFSRAATAAPSIPTRSVRFCRNAPLAGMPRVQRAQRRFGQRQHDHGAQRQRQQGVLALAPAHAGPALGRDRFQERTAVLPPCAR